MNIKDLREKIAAEIVTAKLKVENAYVALVDAGENATNELERNYLESVDELNAKFAEARLAARSFVKRYGKKIVIGGAIVIGILAVGYIVGYLAV